MASEEPPTESQDLDQLSIALREAHRTFDHQIDMYENQSTHALEIIKINLLLAAFFVAYGRLTTTPMPDFIVLFGVGPLVLSVILSTIAFLLGNYTVGMNAEGLAEFGNRDAEFVEEGKALVLAYGQWTRDNFSRGQRASSFVYWSIVSLMAALGSMTAWIAFF